MSGFIEQHSETVVAWNYQSPKCWLQFLKMGVIYYNFRHTFVCYLYWWTTVVFIITDYTLTALGTSTVWVAEKKSQRADSGRGLGEEAASPLLISKGVWESAVRVCHPLPTSGVADFDRLTDFDRFLAGVDFFCSLRSLLYLQCFDAVGWAAGRASGL